MDRVRKLRNDAAHRLPVVRIRDEVEVAVKAAILMGDPEQGRKIQGLVDVWIEKEKVEGQDHDGEDERWEEAVPAFGVGLLDDGVGCGGI